MPDPPRCIVHVDMDAFYASVEQRDDPALRGRPVVVGGHPTRGVVLAASYEVRRFGVRSAMPMARAVQLCPDACVVPPRFDAYAAASEALHAILESYTPLVEPLSLDEAFLDVTGSRSLHGDGPAIARAIRQRIRDTLSLPASAGVADVKFAAKIASDFAKPDGLHVVPAGGTRAFLEPLPVWRLWGVGPRTEARLQAYGLATIGDVARQREEDLARWFGDAGRHLWQLSHGIDGRDVVPDRAAKSIGAEDTFAEDVSDTETLHTQMLSQAHRVARRLRRAGLEARSVAVKVKFADFAVVTRRTTLPTPSADSGVLSQAARRLLEKVERAKPVRLVGLSAQDLGAAALQGELFTDSRRRARLNAALDAVQSKFGRSALVPADLLPTASDAPTFGDVRRGGSRD